MTSDSNEFDNVESLETQPAPALATGNRRIIGRYKLLQKLGSGGMGEVWLAEQEHPIRRRVAVKIIKSGIDSNHVIARFEAERQALALMDHTNIAKVLDAGQTDDHLPYFVMELVNGTPITAYCDANEATIPERLALFQQVCLAVQHAHQKGIIHRDLKPSNVLVCQVDGVPVPKVIDFGLAKATEPHVKLTDKTLFTEFGQIVGTVQYMSPEQAEMKNLDIDTRTDIYSLGVILYELLTGSTPLDEETVRGNAIFRLMEMIRTSETPRPSTRLNERRTVATGISSQQNINRETLTQLMRSDLDWIALKALEKDRTRRYETAIAFAEDVQRFLSSEPILARPPSRAYRTRKFLRKHRGPLTAAATVILLLLAGITATSGAYLRASRSESVAKDSLAKTEVALDKAAEAKNTANTETKKAQQLASSLRRRNYNFTLQRAHDLMRNNVGLALPMLEDEDLCPVDLRETTWRFLHAQARQHELCIEAHAEGVKLIAISPNGKLVASASNGNEVRIWDASDGTRIKTLICPKMGVQRLQMSFSPDSSKLAAVCHDTLTVWDVASGRVLEKFGGGGTPGAFDDIREFHTFLFRELDQLWWAGVTGASQVTIEQAESGRNAILSDADHLYSPKAVVERRCCNEICVGLKDGHIRVFDSKTGELLRELPKKQLWISTLSISAAGNRIASQDAFGHVFVWDLINDEVCFETTSAISPSAMALSSNGQQLAVPNNYGHIILWDIDRNVRTILQGHSADITDLWFHPDSKKLFSCSADGTIRSWDTQKNKRGPKILVSEEPSLLMTYGPNGNLYTGDAKGRIHVADPDTDTLKLYCDEYTEPLRSLAVAPSGQFVAVRAGNSVWTVDTSDRRKHALVASDNRFAGGGIALSPDSKQIFYSHYSCLVEASEPGFSKKAFRDAYNHYIYCMAASSVNKTIAAGTRNGHVIIADQDTLKVLRRIRCNGNFVNSIEYSHNGLLLASGGNDRRICIIDAKAGTLSKELLGHDSPINSLAFDQDDETLISCDAGGTIVFWDVSSGQQRLRVDSKVSPWGQASEAQHETKVTIKQVSVSPDGRTVAALGGGRVFLSEISAETPQSARAKPSLLLSQDTGSEVLKIHSSEAASHYGRVIETKLEVTACYFDGARNECILKATPDRTGSYQLDVLFDGMTIRELPTEARNLPAAFFLDKNVEVSGRVVSHLGNPCIWVTDARNIKWENDNIGLETKVESIKLLMSNSDKTSREDWAALSLGQYESGMHLESYTTLQMYVAAFTSQIKSGEITSNYRGRRYREYRELIDGLKLDDVLSNSEFAVKYFALDLNSDMPPIIDSDLISDSLLATESWIGIEQFWKPKTLEKMIGRNDFLAVVEGTLELVAGEYMVSNIGDESIRVYLDGKLILDKWNRLDNEASTAKVTAKAGKHDFRIEYCKRSGWTVLNCEMFRLSSL